MLRRIPWCSDGIPITKVEQTGIRKTTPPYRARAWSLQYWTKKPLPDLKKLSVNDETIEQKKERHVSCWFQKLAPSSRENSTPPIGAPKAAATPAAAPEETKSRFSVSLRKSAKKGVLWGIKENRVVHYHKPKGCRFTLRYTTSNNGTAMNHGAFFTTRHPSANLVSESLFACNLTLNMTPMALAAKVFSRRTWETLTPLR